MRASAVWRLHHGTLRAVVQSRRLRKVVQVQSLPVLSSITIAAAAAATRGLHSSKRDRCESGDVRELVRAEVGDGALPPMQVQKLRVLCATHTAAASSRSATAAEAARAPRRRGDAERCHVRAAADWRRERARLRLLLQAEIRRL